MFRMDVHSETNESSVVLQTCRWPVPAKDTRVRRRRFSHASEIWVRVWFRRDRAFVVHSTCATISYDRPCNARHQSRIREYNNILQSIICDVFLILPYNHFQYLLCWHNVFHSSHLFVVHSPKKNSIFCSSLVIFGYRYTSSILQEYLIYVWYKFFIIIY